MEELFERLQRKEEAMAKFEHDRRRGARAAEDTAPVESAKDRRERQEAQRAATRNAALQRRLQEAEQRRLRSLGSIRDRTVASMHGAAHLDTMCAPFLDGYQSSLVFQRPAQHRRPLQSFCGQHVASGAACEMRFTLSALNNSSGRI
jgi:hypothetical protein